MRCGQCQFANPPAMNFCVECGAKLALPCPHCGAENQPTFKFCGACGTRLGVVEPVGTATSMAAEAAVGLQEYSAQSYTPAHLAAKILTSRSALEGERKQVTVLFTDVSGFTALSERLDPEDVHQLMERAFALILDEVHHYEGTVNQFLGDGIMALFGAPIAHEDHPIRAVHAALGMQHALAEYRQQLQATRGIDFQVRMGLNTGAVVVGSIGDNLRMDYTAVGDTTNLAARLLGLAAPGQIFIGNTTARVVEPYFYLQALGEMVVKGKEAPVQAYRVEGRRGVRSRLEAALERGLTPLVGRERELALLLERFAEVQAGRGQTAFVFGEAGIGKSRLLIEFRRQVEAAGARWLIGRCVSYGQGMVYLPLLDVVRTLTDLQETDDAATLLSKIDNGIQHLGDDLRWTMPFVRALLGLNPSDRAVQTMNPVQRHTRTGEALRALILGASKQQPVVLFIEDLHWIDAHSEAVIRMLLEGIAAAPVLVLLTHRPGYTPPYGEQTYYTRITLHRLSESQLSAMVSHVLQSDTVPAEVVALIAQRAEGNPLYVEELCKALVEDGTLQRRDGGYVLTRPLTEATIPGTIQGVIMARIDRLPETAKAALQTAAVVGREFTARLLERVAASERDTAQALGELRAVELIYEKTLYPELAYLFKHALTHDVAYESLLKQRRRVLHQRVGEAIEGLYSERLPEFFATLAWHYGRSEAWPKAVHYLLQAAEQARARYAYAEAICHGEEAAAILTQHGGTAEEKQRVFELLGDLHSLQGRVEPANQAYDQALEHTELAARQQCLVNKRHRPAVALRDGARIAYYEHGTGEPTLFLTHPVVYGLGTFQPILELLCQEFRIITVDPRGAGQSDPLPGRYLIRDHVEDARAVIEATGNRPVVFVGISRTAAIAVTFAATYPHLVQQLVLIGTSYAPLGARGRPFDPQHWTQRFMTAARAGNREQAYRIWWETACSEPGSRDLIESFVQMSRDIPWNVIENFFAEDPGRDIRSLLPTLRVPTLVLHGGEDHLTSLEDDGRYLAEHIPTAQFYVFQGRCHLPMFTATAEFAQVVHHFVRTGQVA